MNLSSCEHKFKMNWLVSIQQMVFLLFLLIDEHTVACALPRYDSLIFSSNIIYFSIGNASNYQFMAKTYGYLDKAPLTILRRNESGFEEISQLFCFDCAVSDSLVIGSFRFNSDCSRILMINGGTIIPVLRIYSTTNQRTFKLVQKIPYVANLIGQNQIVSLSRDDQFLMVAHRLYTYVYQKDGTGLYNTVFNATVSAALNVKARSTTPDGLFLIQDINQSSLTVLCIYGYDNTTYIFLSYYDIGTPTVNIKKISMGESSISGKYRVIIYTNVNAQYFDLTTISIPLSATLTLIQTIDTALNGYLDGYLTLNGLYLLLSNKTLNYREFYLYQYNSLMNTYDQRYVFTGLLPDYAGSLYVSQDGQLAIAAITSYQVYSTSSAPLKSAIYFFACNVTFCTNCSWLNVCGLCNSGFILVNNACVCPSGSNLFNNTCVNCSIDHCTSCNASLNCSACSGGYTLINNTCHCSSGRNVSLLSGNCVICNISNCSRCDRDNDCSVFSVDYILTSLNSINGTPTGGSLSTNSSSSQASNNQISQLRNMQIFIIAAIACILILLIAGFLYLAKKLNSINSYPQINDQVNKTGGSKISDKPMRPFSSMNAEEIKSSSFSESKINRPSEKTIKVRNIEESDIPQLDDDIDLPHSRRLRKRRTRKTEENGSKLDLNFDSKIENNMAEDIPSL